MDEFSLKEAPELFCNYIDILFTLREQQDVFFSFFGYDEDSEVFEILRKNNKIEEDVLKLASKMAEEKRPKDAEPLVCKTVYHEIATDIAETGHPLHADIRSRMPRFSALLWAKLTGEEAWYRNMAESILYDEF